MIERKVPVRAFKLVGPVRRAAGGALWWRTLPANDYTISQMRGDAHETVWSRSIGRVVIESGKKQLDRYWQLVIPDWKGE
jgi:hypothetical protein